METYSLGPLALSPRVAALNSHKLHLRSLSANAADAYQEHVFQLLLIYCLIIILVNKINQNFPFFAASSTATATATVIPTIGLFPAPISPIIST